MGKKMSKKKIDVICIDCAAPQLESSGAARKWRDIIVRMRSTVVIIIKASVYFSKYFFFFSF